MKLTVVLSLFCALACADDAEKPVCNAKTRDQFWPAEANADREANRRLAQRGELQICSYGKWKYGWKSLSINIRDLAREQATAQQPGKGPTDTRPPRQLEAVN
jgi:hypothetical protein